MFIFLSSIWVRRYSCTLAEELSSFDRLVCATQPFAQGQDLQWSLRVDASLLSLSEGGVVIPDPGPLYVSALADIAIHYAQKPSIDHVVGMCVFSSWLLSP